jgi:hypothetical protein
VYRAKRADKIKQVTIVVGEPSKPVTVRSTVPVNCDKPGYTHAEGSGATITKYVGAPKTCSLTTTTKCDNKENTKTWSDEGDVGTNTVVVGKTSLCKTITSTSTLDCYSKGYTSTWTASGGPDVMVEGKPAVCTVTTTCKF